MCGVPGSSLTSDPELEQPLFGPDSVTWGFASDAIAAGRLGASGC
jgi:hypothetical protein